MNDLALKLNGINQNFKKEKEKYAMIQIRKQ